MEEVLRHEGLGLRIGSRRNVCGKLAVCREAIFSQGLAIETDAGCSSVIVGCLCERDWRA
jgi:hypothetical protein